MIDPDKVKVKIRPDGYFLSVQTKKAKYGQFYPRKSVIAGFHAIRRFVNFYNNFE